MSTPTSGSATPSPTLRSGGDTEPLVTSQGKTQIADTVVSKIAGVAARDVNGVYKLGGGGARAMGAIRERIPGETSSRRWSG